jgi:hypothetical protein
MGISSIDIATSVLRNTVMAVPPAVYGVLTSQPGNIGVAR